MDSVSFLWCPHWTTAFTVVTVGERYFSVYFLTHLLLPALISSHRKCYKQKHLQRRCGVKDDSTYFVTKEFSVEKQLLFSDVTRQAYILSFWNLSRWIKCKTIHRKIAKKPNVILLLQFLKNRRYYVHLKEDFFFFWKNLLRSTNDNWQIPDLGNPAILPPLGNLTTYRTVCGCSGILKLINNSLRKYKGN